jgi:TolB protein
LRSGIVELLERRDGQFLMRRAADEKGALGMKNRTLVALAALVIVAAALGGRASVGRTSIDALAAGACAKASCFSLSSTIAFSGNRDNLSLVLAHPTLGFEVYLLNPVEARADRSNVRRLTQNTDGDGFAAVSPNGKKIVFDSNRNRPPPGSLPCPVAPGGTDDPSYFLSDLFLMDTDGEVQTLLIGGSSSATWSPDSKDIAFHASASGAGCPSRSDPGAAATDSDIFVANVDDLLAGVEQPRNITNSPDKIDDDADWSATGRIVYTAHDVGDDITNPNNPQGAASNSAELYSVNADGSDRRRLTDNTFEERAPSWSPSGDKIVYSCRIDGGFTDFEICVIDADGTNRVQLTNNAVADLTATFSPDGRQIVFQRPVPGQGNQLFTMRPTLNEDGTRPTSTQLTFAPGMNLLPNWGELRIKDRAPAVS